MLYGDDIDSIIKEPYEFVWSRPTNKPYQFHFTFKYPEVFQAVSRLIHSFAIRHSGFSKVEREKIDIFIKTLIPLCYQVELQDVEDLDSDDDSYSTHTEDSANTYRSLDGNEDHNSDLIRDSLARKTIVIDDDDTKSERSVMSVEMSAQKAPEATFDFVQSFKESCSGIIENRAILDKTKLRTFFGNTSFYCFFRQYETIYQRLAKFYKLDKKAKKQVQLPRLNSTALKLGLYTSQFENIDISNGYLYAVIKLTEQFFDGKLTQDDFEEYTRYLSARNAYLVFSIDRLINALIKQILIITTDRGSVELVRLFCNYLSKKIKLPNYKEESQAVVGAAENLYKIDFFVNELGKPKAMTMQLFGESGGDPNPENRDGLNQLERKKQEEVVLPTTTNNLRRTCLMRNLTRQTQIPFNSFSRSGILYVFTNAFRMDYLSRTEDVFFRLKRPQTKLGMKRKIPSTDWTKRLLKSRRKL